jgi:hypothetical protein
MTLRATLRVGGEALPEQEYELSERISEDSFALLQLWMAPNEHEQLFRALNVVLATEYFGQPDVEVIYMSWLVIGDHDHGRLVT